jgi:uncharacterized membrane protein
MGPVASAVAGQVSLARSRQAAGHAGRLAALLALAAALRLTLLGGWSLWLDELWTVYVAARYSLSGIAAPLDQHPPLYYVWQHYWLQLGQSESWLRLPSAVAGTLAVIVLYQTGRALGRPSLGWWAALLLAVSPIHVWYSRDARMYGPASLMWALSLYYSVQVWRRGSRLDGLGLAASTLSGLYLTYSTLALWVLELGSVALVWRLAGRPRSRLVLWLGAQALITLGFLAWAPVLLRQLQRSSVFSWQVPAALGPPLGGLGFSITLAQTFQWALAAAGLLLVALLALLAWLGEHRKLWAWQRRRTIWIAAGVLAVFLALAAFGAVPRALSVRRQLLVFWPLAVVAAAWALHTLDRRWLPPLVIGGLGLLCLPSIVGPDYQDLRGAVRYVASQAAPGDTLALHPGYLAATLDYYIPAQLTYAGVEPLRASPLLPVPPAVPGGRVWLLMLLPERLDPGAAVLGWFEARAARTGTQPFSNVVVHTFVWSDPS